MVKTIRHNCTSN